MAINILISRNKLILSYWCWWLFTICDNGFW